MNYKVFGLALTTSLGLIAWMPSITAQTSGSKPAPATSTNWYNCLTREVWTPAKKVWCEKMARLQAVEFLVPTSPISDSSVVSYKTVTLPNGTYKNEADRYLVQLLNRPGLVQFGDVNGDRKEDAVVLMVINTGGSGQFVYLATVLDINGKATALPPVLLGDRVQPKSVAIETGQIAIDMVTQGPNDPLCCPTKPVKQTYQIRESLVLTGEKNVK
jgi:hypothetical protein